ncbi:MAG TPA: DUF1330 domain-containing protein [Kiloniellales bacterium]
MAGYLVAHIEITDADAFKAYRAAVPAVIAKFGGRYLVRGGETEVREGEWPASRLVIVAFDSVDQARRFYESPEYQEILPLRLNASRGTLAIVDGIESAA